MNSDASETANHCLHNLPVFCPKNLDFGLFPFRIFFLCLFRDSGGGLVQSCTHKVESEGRYDKLHFNYPEFRVKVQQFLDIEARKVVVWVLVKSLIDSQLFFKKTLSPMCLDCRPLICGVYQAIHAVSQQSKQLGRFPVDVLRQSFKFFRVVLFHV